MEEKRRWEKGKPRKTVWTDAIRRLRLKHREELNSRRWDDPDNNPKR